MLSDAPSRIMANFSTFLEVNFSPLRTSSVGFQKLLINMPINSAITDAPIRWMGSRDSSHLAMAAMHKASANPGSKLRMDLTCFISLSSPATL